MKHPILVLFVAGCLSLPAQEPVPNTSGKGAAPLNQSTNPEVSGSTNNQTRAVVIGISDYQNLPDLQYADRDARAFAAWLQSPAGGSVPRDNIRLSINEQATMSQIYLDIAGLIQECRAGDRALIYLSGHGDVESLTEFNFGYFLAYNTPPNVYWGNAFSLRDLQAMISAMSGKGVQVLVISDACRSGKLAGSEIGGAQATAGQLATQFSNAIVLLSCQPDEFSHESDQWGGGRGLFSYHLENALYGMADQNRDLFVDLREVRNHLEERVPAEASPNKQTPMVQGLISTRLATVDPPTLAQHQARIGNFPMEIKYTGGKTLEQFPDSLVYHQFLTAIEAGRLMAPAGESANDYYEKIVSNPEWAPYHGQVKRKFVVALADEAQLVVNKLLRTDPKVADEAFPGRVRYAHLPAYLARAGEILGEGHYLYRYLKAKQYFFEAKTYTKTQYPELSPDSLFKLSNEALDKGLAYDPEAAYIHLEKGIKYFWNIQLGTAAESFDKALKLSPTWVLAIYYYARAIDFMGGRPTAVRYLKEALRYDSTFLPVYERLGFFTSGPEQIYWRNEYVRRMEEWLAKDPDNIPATYYRYQGLTLHYLGRNDEAEKYLLKGAEMTNWEDPLYYKQLGMVYEEQGRHADMCKCYEKYFEVHPKNYETYTGLAICGKYPKVRKIVLQWYQQDTTKLDDLDALWLLERANHRFDQAKKTGKKIIELMESTGIYDQNLLTKGNLYWWYGDLAKADITLREYIRIEEASGDQGRIGNLGGAYGPYNQLACVKMVQGDWEEARKWWLKRDALSGDTTGNGWRQWIAFSRGQMDEVRRLDSLAETRKQVPDILNLKGDGLFLAGSYDLFDFGINRMENARQYYPNHAELHYHLARLYLEQKNDYARGVPLLERAVQLASTFAAAHYHLAAACAHLGRNDAAPEHLQKALENGYEDWEELAGDGRWEGLRGSAAYRELMGRIKN